MTCKENHDEKNIPVCALDEFCLAGRLGLFVDFRPFPEHFVGESSDRSCSSSCKSASGKLESVSLLSRRPFVGEELRRYCSSTCKSASGVLKCELIAGPFFGVESEMYASVKMMSSSEPKSELSDMTSVRLTTSKSESMVSDGRNGR